MFKLKPVYWPPLRGWGATATRMLIALIGQKKATFGKDKAAFWVWNQTCGSVTCMWAPSPWQEDSHMAEGTRTPGSADCTHPYSWCTNAWQKVEVLGVMEQLMWRCCKAGCHAECFGQMDKPVRGSALSSWVNMEVWNRTEASCCCCVCVGEKTRVQIEVYWCWHPGILGLLTERSGGLIYCRPTGRWGCIISLMCLLTNLGFHVRNTTTDRKTMQTEESERNLSKWMCLSVCSLCVPSEDTVCSPALTHSVWGDLRLNQQCVWPSLYKNYTQHGSACLVCSPLVMPSCSWSTAVIYTPKHTHTHMPVCTQSGGTGWVMQRAVEFHRCLTDAVLRAPEAWGAELSFTSTSVAVSTGCAQANYISGKAAQGKETQLSAEWLKTTGGRRRRCCPLLMEVRSNRKGTENFILCSNNWHPASVTYGISRIKV